jgi:hypothetical protein
MRDAITTIGNLIEDDEQVIEQVCSRINIIKIIIEQLKEPLDEDNHPAIKVISIIFQSINSNNIDIFLFHGTLDALNNLLTESQKLPQVKEILFSFSNLTAGSDEQIA